MIGIVVLLLFIIIIQYVTMIKIMDLEDEIYFYNRHLNDLRREVKHERKHFLD